MSAAAAEGDQEFLQFWGKARAAEGAEVTWHPVAYHLLDVAAMADAILGARPIALARASRLLRLEVEDAKRLLVALVALHDLGKYAPAFQAKSVEHWPAALVGLSPDAVPPSHHTADGYALWEGVLGDLIAERLWAGARGVLDTLALSIFGHHGRPVRSADARRRARSIYGDVGLNAALACADAVVGLLLPAPVDVPPPSLAQARLASWWVSGLVTVADWVGSNDRWFEYSPPEYTLTDYWLHARECAGRALKGTGMAAPCPAPAKSFTELTGKTDPTPAQRWASEVELPEGPMLVILEDVTGAGKTEAAQVLVHRLMADGRAAGAYWAMPTTATANAMFERQQEAVDALFTDDSDAPRPSVVLAHGQARLNQRFQATVLRDPDARLDTAASRDPGLTAATACAAFLADDRRAALLADVGAGTVDQAILGALPSRFNTVRLFGMADKVLVFDEAHAYDAYMGVEIQQLLRFQAALGGSAIVLSATLTLKQREGFATAWMEGLASGERRVAPLFTGSSPALAKSLEYPLGTIVAAGERSVSEEAIDPAEWSRRTVAIRFVRSEQDALDHIISSAKRGAAAVWIRNTVADCLNAAAAVREVGYEPIVFHARFAQSDRQKRELEVLNRFGEHGAAERRRGAILIATQVVEQSLDLDFDVMVSDLAPVDLLIQRAGRLWRHPARQASRPDGLECELVVLSPPTDTEPDKDWITALLPKMVYKHTGVLWRTAKQLEGVGEIVTPEGLRGLVEAVYASDDTPDALLPAAQAAEGKEFGDAATANHGVLRPSEGYHGDACGWVDDMRVPTRLGEEQTAVRLARVAPDGQLMPWATDGGARWKRWALSEVRLSGWQVPFGSSALPEYQAAVDAVRQDWGRFEQETTMLPLTEDGSGGWVGELVRPDNGRTVSIRYSAAQGVEYA